MRDGWTETALGSVLKLSNKKLGPHKEEPEIFAISKYDGVVLAQDYFDRRIASKSLDGYKVIGPGDWVYSTIHIDEGSIAVNHFPFRGVVSPMYTSMIWNSHLHDYRFFEFLLKSDGALIRYQENAQGTVNRRRSLSWKAFSEITFVVPPLDEQKRIVDVLSSVDAYIDALQQQADTARTARNAVLDSLLEQVSGSSIEHSLKEIAVERGLIGGPFGSSLGAKDYKEFGIPVIRGKNIPQKSEFIDGPFVYVSEQKAHELSRNVAKPGDLIATQRGTLGQVGIVPSTPFVDYVISQSQMRLRPRGDLALTKFLYLQMSRQDFVNEILSREVSTANPHINLGIFAELKLKLPPLTEQKRIVEIVSSMDDVIQSTEQAVTDAKNLRSGLLSDLLSGEHEIPMSYDKFLKAA